MTAVDTALRLNLGCCDTSRPGFIGVDIAPPADQIVDLAQYPWPWGTASVLEVVAHDLVEHLPDRIATMNEIHRICRNGARVELIVPNAAKGSGFWQDPTHKTGWCLNSFQYFEAGSFAHRRLARHYGITAAFRIVSLTERPYRDVYEEVWKITAVLEVVK